MPNLKPNLLQPQELSLDSATGAENFRKSSFVLGFLTNATNPKATLFFLAVFTTVVSASTPLSIQMLYGGWMCFINALWFVLVSLIFASESMRQRFLRIGHWFEQIMGVLLIAFYARIFWTFFTDELELNGIILIGIEKERLK